MTDVHAAARGWLTGRLPAGWFTSPPDVTVDREEILVVGTIEIPSLVDAAGDDEREAALAGRIRAFREDTRDARIAIAREAERAFGRKLAWGVQCGGRREIFTSRSVPVMTRLRQPERQIIDTLVAAGVARSRSDALAWCVRLVGQHTGDWLAELRHAMDEVDRVRRRGPAA